MSLLNTYTVTVLSDGDQVDEPIEVKAQSLRRALVNTGHLIHASLIEAGDEINIALKRDNS